MDQQSTVFDKKVYDPVFRAHGIPKQYLDKWFGNYEISNEAQQNAFDNIIACNGTTRPIVMLGKYGCGKTHLATALVKNAIILRKSAYYHTLTSLFREYRCSLNNPEFNEVKFFNRIFNYDVLVIDEVNIRSDSGPENRIIQEIVDKRCAENNQTVFIGNMNKELFENIMTERLLDRLSGEKAAIINFNWGSYRRGGK